MDYLSRSNDDFGGLPRNPIPSSNGIDNFLVAASSDNISRSWIIDGLLESLGKPKAEQTSGGCRKVEDLDGFDEVIHGFSGSSPPQQRASSEINHMHSKKATSVSTEPFVVLEKAQSSAYSQTGLFTDPLENISKTTISESTNTASPNEGTFDDTGDFEMLAKSVPSYTASIRNDNQSGMSSQRNVQNDSSGCSTSRKESPEGSTIDPFELLKMKNVIDNFESDYLFEKPSKHSSSTRKITNGVQNSDINVKMSERGVMSDVPPRLVDGDEVCLTVAEIPLFRLPTTTPPASRTPLISKQHPSRKEDYTGPFVFDADNKEAFCQYNQTKYLSERLGNSVNSGIPRTDENLSRCILQTYANEHADVFLDEVELGSNSAAAESVDAMKVVAMDRAEVKFRQAREVREIVHDTKSTKTQHFQNQGNPTEMLDVHDDEDKKRQERLKHERTQRERDEAEKRHERERDLELERERERDRQAEVRAMWEARERAAVEIRRKAERAAVKRANAKAHLLAAAQEATALSLERAAADARERAERALAEARERAERALAEARERAERALAEAREARAREAIAAMEATKESFAVAARERAAAEEAREKVAATREKDAAERAKEEARHSAKRAAVVRVAVEARERALAESREWVAAVFREQRYNESFGMDVRETSTPKRSANSSRIADTLDIVSKGWAAGKEGNLRALLSTLHYVLWPECGWQPVSLGDLRTAASVKEVYEKAIWCIHPDKVHLHNYLAEKVFNTLKEAWNNFKF